MANNEKDEEQSSRKPFVAQADRPRSAHQTRRADQRATGPRPRSDPPPRQSKGFLGRKGLSKLPRRIAFVLNGSLGTVTLLRSIRRALA